MLSELGIDIGNFFVKKTRINQVWQDNYKAYADFIFKNYGKPKESIEAEIKLTRWEKNQRQRYKKGNLSELQLELLAKVGITNEVEIQR